MTKWISIYDAEKKYGVNYQTIWDRAKAKGIETKKAYVTQIFKRKTPQRFIDADALDKLMRAWEEVHEKNSEGL